MPDTLSQRLARFAASLRYEDLPPEVVDKVKASILHLIGVGLAGSTAASVQAARATVLETESAPNGGATILVEGTRSTPYGAAFVNSALMHAKLQEDGYQTASHPGVAIVPAALAAAELSHASGRELIAAVAAGYEVQTAMSDGIIPKSNARGFRSSPAYGPFGAAAAAGSVLKLSTEQLTHALGYAATFAGGAGEGGPRQHIFVLQVAFAPRSGLLAAVLARNGATASPNALDGPRAWYHSFTGSSAGLEQIGGELGKRWGILDVCFKIYPAAMLIQPVIELAATLCREHDVQPEAIASVLVEMNDGEAGPAFNTDFGAAAACVNRGFAVPPDRPPGWNAPDEGMERLPTHPQTQKLLERVQVTGSAAIAPLAPRVTITLTNGKVLQAAATGDEFKFGLARDKDVIRALLPELPFTAERVERLIRAVEQLDTAPDVSELIAAAVR